MKRLLGLLLDAARCFDEHRGENSRHKQAQRQEPITERQTGRSYSLSANAWILRDSLPGHVAAYDPRNETERAHDKSGCREYQRCFG